MLIVKEDIISRINNGDAKAFEQLYTTFYVYLCAVATKYVYNSEAAREIVNDVFMNVWNHHSALIHPVNAYLIRSVRNYCLNYLRDKRQQEVPLSDVQESLLSIQELQIDADPHPLAYLENKEFEEKIYRAVDSLPAKCRDIFVQYLYHNKTYEEIAITNHISSSTVRVQIKIGLAKLRELSEALGQLDEVGLAVGVGLGEALAIESGLPLAHHAKHLIVEDDRDDGQLVADSSAGFVEVHVEGAVAGEHDHPLVAAQRHLCADGCAVTEAHGAEAAAGDEAAALGVADVLCRPHLVLAHIGDVDRLGAALVADLADDLMGHQAGGVGYRVVILCLPLVDHLHPVGMLFLLDHREHGVQHIGGVAHDGKVNIHVLAQLAGVDVDLDDGRILGEGLGVQGHTVGEAGTHRNKDITVGHRPVRGVAAVHTHHADVHRVAVRHDACGHQGISGRDLSLFQKVTQGLAAGRRADAAAEVDQRALCAVDDLCRPLDLLFVEGGHGADGLRLFRGELTHRSGDILRDVHQHRAFAAALGDTERRTHGVGQVFDPAHREVVLGNGHRDALDVGFLEAVLAQALRGHVAGESHHRHRVHIGGGDAGDEVRCARAAGGQHHAGAARCTGVAVRRVGCALLVGSQHMGDAVGVFVQLVVEVQHCAAGVAEEGVHPLLTEHLHKDLRTVQLHGEFLLFPFPISTLYTFFPNTLRDSTRYLINKRSLSPYPRDKDLESIQNSLRYHSR